ncbi:MAG: DUF4190 domain-containing protein [Planctomycetota bacterium]
MQRQDSAFEFRCVGCGYVLRGLRVDQNCPECGLPVAASMRAGGGGRPTSGMAIASMVCGIVGIPGLCFYGFGIVLGVLAVVFGEIANRQIKRGEVSAASKGFATAGRICGWISIAVGLAVIGVIVFVVVMP